MSKRIILSGGTDLPSINDYTLAELEEVGASSQAQVLPKESINQRTPVLDQKSTNACSVFSLTKIDNEQNALEANKEGYEGVGPQSEPFGLWDTACEEYGADRNQGWSLQASLAFFRTLKKTAGYVKAMSEEEMKRSITRGRFIATGSNRCDWRVTMRTGVFTPLPDRKTGAGHLFAITSCCEEGGLSPNSYGEDQKPPKGYEHLKGYFLIKWADLPYLYTRYSVLSSEDSAALAQIASKRECAELLDAVRLKIWNGEREDDAASEDECHIMLQRATGVSLGDRATARKSLTRARVALLANEYTLKAYGQSLNWSPTMPARPITRKEMARVAVRARRLAAI